MNWDKVKGMIAGVAPVLGTLVGGPGVGAILSGILGSGESSRDIALALKDPDALEKIRRYEMDHKERLQAMQLKEVEVAMQDRDSARKMQTTTGSRTPAVLATVVVVGFFGVLYALMAHGATMPPAAKDPLLILLGTLAGAFSQVFNFYFGSSAGSKQKTNILGK